MIVRIAKRRCSSCHFAAIQKKNKTGMCLACYKAYLRKNAKRRKCSECAGPVCAKGKTGLCARCLILSRRPAPRLCSHGDCQRQVGLNSKTGLCPQHKGMRIAPPNMTERAMGAARLVARELGIPVREILGRGKFRSVVDARAALIALLRDQKLSLPRIGEIIGRDHSSVHNALSRLPKYMARNPALAQLINERGGC